MIAHGAGGTFDELFLVAAVAAGAFGIVRMLDSNKPWRQRWLGAVAIVAGAGLGASPFALGLGRVKPAKIRPVSTATVSIEQPPPGATLSGRTLSVLLRLDGGRIVDFVSTKLTPTEGHIHISIDGKLQAMTTLDGEIDISKLARGPHTLRAEFVAADHAPFATPVAHEIGFSKT